VALAHFRAEIPASAGMTRRRRPPRLPPARSTTSSRTKMGADVAASPRFPKLTIAMPRQGHHPLGGWAPRDGASAVSGPRGSRPGREGLGGSLRAEDKAEAWMPSSRFRNEPHARARRSAPKRPLPNERRSPRLRRPRVPPETKVPAFPLGRSEPAAEAPDPHRLALPRRASPPQRPPSRPTKPKQAPTPRTARPSRKDRSPRPTPVSRPRNRSEPRSLEPPDRHESLDPRSDPFRDSPDRSEPQSFEPPDAAEGASPFAATRFASLAIEANLDPSAAGPFNESRSPRPKTRSKADRPKPLPPSPPSARSGRGPFACLGG
jgi:hypothetical protein